MGIPEVFRNPIRQPWEDMFRVSKDSLGHWERKGVLPGFSEMKLATVIVAFLSPITDLIKRRVFRDMLADFCLKTTDSVRLPYFFE